MRSHLIFLREYEATLAAEGRLRLIARPSGLSPARYVPSWDRLVESDLGTVVQFGDSTLYKVKGNVSKREHRIRFEVSPVRSPFGGSGDILYAKEAFWAKHDLEFNEAGGNTIDWGPHLTSAQQFCSEIQPCADPDCLHPPKLEGTQTYTPWEGDPTPGTWFLSPPETWDGTTNYREAGLGTWIYLPWEHYSKRNSPLMPTFAARRYLLRRAELCRSDRVLAEEMGLITGLPWPEAREFFRKQFPLDDSGKVEYLWILTLAPSRGKLPAEINEVYLSRRIL